MKVGIYGGSIHAGDGSGDFGVGGSEAARGAVRVLAAAGAK